MLNRIKVLAVMVVTIFTLSTAGLAVASGNHSDPADCNGDPSGKSNTGHGANQSGPYDNTCPAGESQNGNGNGNAGGRPCAGCVGNADDKNPPGQMPGGSDHNNGYECDGNNGVGKGNPAHTGCTSSTGTGNTPPGNTPPGNTPPGNTPPGSTPPGNTPPGSTLTGSTPAVEGTTITRSTPAVEGSSQISPITLTLAAKKTSVLGEKLIRGPKATAVLGVKVVRGMPLPRTGIGSDLMLIVALSLVIIGMVAVKVGMRPRIQN